MEKDYRLFSAQNIVQAEKWFRKYGYFLILLNRFFPGIRSIISLAGGISNLGTFRVALLALISAAAWNLIWDRHRLFTGEQLGNGQGKNGGISSFSTTSHFWPWPLWRPCSSCCESSEKDGSQKQKAGIEPPYFRVTASIQAKNGGCPFSMGILITQGQT